MNWLHLQQMAIDPSSSLCLAENGTKMGGKAIVLRASQRGNAAASALAHDFTIFRLAEELLSSDTHTRRNKLTMTTVRFIPNVK